MPTTTSRYITLFLWLIAQAIGKETMAQAVVHSKAEVEWAMDKEGETKCDAIVFFNTVTREITATIDLGAFLKNRNLEDSLRDLNKVPVLTVKWLIGAEPIEGYSAKDDEKTLKLQARVSIGDSLQLMDIPLIFNVLRDRNNPTFGGGYEANSIQARVSMGLAIDPVLFGLQKAPFLLTRRFVVELENAQVNKK